jgi:hypothetical protein
VNARRQVSHKGRILGLAKLAIAAALLVWVGLGLPWQDRLLYVEGQDEISVEGTIEGNWRDEAIRFLPSGDVKPASDWPADLTRAVESGEPLAVARRPRTDPPAKPPPGYEWRPSMPRVFREMDAGYLLAAMGALVVGAFFGITRWWRILRLAGCPSTYANTTRLAWLGLFFNLVVPGLTGGDVVKAVLVVREHPERRADALVSVVIDRMIGLWALIGLATSLIWIIGDAFDPLRYPVLLTFGAATAAVAVVLVSRLRRALRIDALLARLPQARRLKELDRAATVFRGRPGELGLAILLSLANHLCVIAGVYAIGQAFGDTLGFGTYIGVTSVANVLSAIPLTPGGWGVGEKAYGTLFELVGSAFALGVAVSVTYRLCNMGLGLVGGAFMLLPGGRRVRGQVREVEQELA